MAETKEKMIVNQHTLKSEGKKWQLSLFCCIYLKRNDEIVPLKTVEWSRRKGAKKETRPVYWKKRLRIAC